MNRSFYRSAVAAAALLCSGVAAAQQPFVARFSPADGVVPSANNLLFSGSADGTLNIPVTDPATAPIVEALNALDGFSTVAPQTTTFSDAIDPATVVAGETVRAFEVDLRNPFLNPDSDAAFAITGDADELTGGVDFTAAVGADGRTLAFVPLRPLKPKTGYMVVLTDGIRAAGGAPAQPDLTYIFARFRGEPLIDDAGRSRFERLDDAQAQLLERIRRVVVSQEDAAADAGVERGAIVFSWSFLTQSAGDVLGAARAQATPAALAVAATGASTAAFIPGLPGLADIYAGALQVPYYLQAPTAVPAVILATQWRGVNDSSLTRYNPAPVATQNLTIPLLASLPNTLEKPATGWPTVIFQHGITRNRTDLIAVADALAAAGLAAVAVDLPLHGITDPANPLYRDGQERTFNVDLINDATGAAGADGVIDASGTHFINLMSLLTSRDNIRQGSADLHQLLISLPALDFDGDGRGDVDLNRIGFWGNSLGGIVGTSFLGLDQDMAVSAGVLTVTGGGIVELLNGSEAFGPRIRAGLAAAGLEPGTAAFAQFLVAAQQAIDSADPLNYAGRAADTHPIYLAEVIGDQVIPNAVPGAPLAGTEPLVRALGLQSIDETTQSEDGIRGVVRFTEGGHGSPLSPADSPAVYLEIQSQAATFLATDGTLLPVTNPSVVVPAD